MAKPILIIGFPAKADPNQVDAASHGLELKFGVEYHVLLYKSSTLEDITFQVLNAEKADDVSLEEILSKVKEEIAELRNENILLKIENAGNKLIQNNP